MASTPNSGAPWWVVYVGPVVAAVLAALGVSTAQSEGQVPDATFERVASSNCEDINDLKGTLRELILSVPPDQDNPEGSEEFTGRALALLTATDCAQRVTP